MRHAGRAGIAATAAALLIAGSAAAPAQTARALPYWASLTAGDALMRTGPGRQYPATWRYRRAALPLRVMAVHETWRKVRDPDGTEGWMASALLGDQRTGMVTGALRPLRSAPDAAAKILWQAEPGVVGRVSHCAGGWCELDVHGRVGYVEAAYLWGVAPGEAVD